MRPAATRAQTLAPDTLGPAAPAAPAPAATLRQARQLVLERRYDSAWRLLAQLDARNADPAIAIEKADLALRYYTATDQLTRFAFRDLKLLDLAPDSLRQLGHDSLRYRFAVRQVLEQLQRRYPDNYRLARALGDYYYTVQQCDCAEEGIGEDEVFLRTITEYQQAHAHGQGDYLSYFALGYAYQRLGRFQASIAPFERSLELRPRNPTAHLNMAFVMLELRELEKARDHARRAQQYFPDAHHKEDAGFLLKEIEERISQTSRGDSGASAVPAAAPLPPTNADAADGETMSDETAQQEAKPKEAAEAKPKKAEPAQGKSAAGKTPKKAPAANTPTTTKARPATSAQPASAAKSPKPSSGKSTVPNKQHSQKPKPSQPAIGTPAP
ncbi:TPR repeat-containing protein [Hymenobacter psychrophilus]|uniref:TPR repeat-containing protein n=2 Tax=Hymenobacter psychrophilus TaxID=651662 RepID=A0A1H3JF22_9BACT|nr:TPR repeat-containing protein [Hymenobacter psychrophilus]